VLHLSRAKPPFTAYFRHSHNDDYGTPDSLKHKLAINNVSPALAKTNNRDSVPFISVLCSAKFGGSFVDKGIDALAEITCYSASNKGIAFSFQLAF
jgi:hypothetical protein